MTKKEADVGEIRSKRVFTKFLKQKKKLMIKRLKYPS